ncbi:hypothetical protein [Nocardia sp. NBC_01009]|uniref:hypothetical protein n=1 Tax=Nocardia sp. NBC_01009 TaxID=2975996 RepID=UPI003866797A|nr:hypothetical protein OHA42_04160 [Nocardia sp. NBC_01009]
MSLCTNPDCAGVSHDSHVCPHRDSTDAPRGRNLAILGVLALMIITALVLAAGAVAER